MSKKVLVVEIDLSNTGDSCIIAIQRVQMENRSTVERQIFIKRSSREDFMSIPEPGNDNFVLSATEKSYES